MFLGLCATDEAIDLILEDAAKDGGDDGGLALRPDIERVVVGVGQQREQFCV